MSGCAYHIKCVNMKGSGGRIREKIGEKWWTYRPAQSGKGIVQYLTGARSNLINPCVLRRTNVPYKGQVQEPGEV